MTTHFGRRREFCKYDSMMNFSLELFVVKYLNNQEWK